MEGEQLIADFKGQHPFTYSYRDINVTATYENFTQDNVLFRYGYYTFSQIIYHGWSSGAYGRIGLNWSQETPYYNAFYSPNGDYCSVGQQVYSAQACSDYRRFSLWIR